MHDITSSTNFKSATLSGRFTVAAIAAASALLFGVGHADAAPPQRSAEGPWAKGRVLVMPRAGLAEGELGKIVGAVGGKASKLTSSGLYLVELPGNASETAIAARLANNPHLKFAELDKQASGTAVVNDPYFGSAWHLSRIGAPSAWDASLGAGVTIAILDTGVDSTHPDLSAHIVPGWNFIDNNSNTSDVNGHGTGVAGTAAATTNNGVGVAAVAAQSKIMPVRIADANAYAYWSAIAQGITYAADKGARVINISYDQLPLSSAVINASQYAKSKGALVVVAAGNRAKDESFTPTTSMIPVSATDANDLITTWSSWGKYVAMSAPGLNIWSTTRGGGYAQWYGTSVASPVTAGVVALMMSANPSLSSSQVESMLFSSADDLGAAGRDSYYGYGRVNASKAVQAALAAKAAVAVTDTQPPVDSIAAPLGLSSVSGLTAVNVSASDNVGVAKVELRVNGSLMAADTTAPFGFSWDSKQVVNGMANLVARACDAAGNCADSATVAVNVANVVNVADTTAPTITFLTPGNGVTVLGTVIVSASSVDNSGVAGLTNTLYLDGVRVASNSGTGLLTYSWNAQLAKAGRHDLRMQSRDAAGNLSSKSILVKR